MERKKTEPQKMSPGDQAPPGTPGTGENICPQCSGSGKFRDRTCPNCNGTGYVVEGIGGA
jgi:DnaJ-class molecular chaperone